MSNLKTILTVIILILIGTNAYTGFIHYGMKKQIEQNQSVIETQIINRKVLEFTDIFIRKVLKADGEIDFDTRLNLENLVRDLEDESILEQWQKFTESKTPTQAQLEVKNLLELLIGKIKT